MSLRAVACSLEDQWPKHTSAQQSQYCMDSSLYAPLVALLYVAGSNAIYMPDRLLVFRSLLQKTRMKLL